MQLVQVGAAQFRHVAGHRAHWPKGDLLSPPGAKNNCLAIEALLYLYMYDPVLPILVVYDRQLASLFFFITFKLYST